MPNLATGELVVPLDEALTSIGADLTASGQDLDNPFLTSSTEANKTNLCNVFAGNVELTTDGTTFTNTDSHQLLNKDLLRKGSVGPFAGEFRIACV